MRLILIYQPVDADKNKEYIKLYQNECKRRGLEFCLMIVKAPGCGVNYSPEGIPFRFFDPDKYPSARDAEPADSIFINRSRDAALTRRLEEAGFTVYNDSLTAELGNDKLKAIRFMEELGIPVMKTYEDAPGKYPFVVKTVDGHGGNEVFLIKDEKELKNISDHFKGRKLIYQEFCDTPGKDKRVYIVGNKVVAAMLRISDTDFRSNYSLGGDAEISELTAEESRIIEKILSRMTIDHAGIDLIYHNAHPVFNELEDVVGSRMLYRYTDIDVVKLFMDHILKKEQDP